jgi:hypothetical protein
MNGAIYVSDSGNAKIIGSQKADATYASIRASCPDSCALKAQGCYAQGGHVGMTVRRLDAAAKGRDVVRAEVQAIDGSYQGRAVPKGRSLRLHVSGDARTTRAARSLAAAVVRWQARGGGLAWSYTHAWRNVKRAAWNTVSVLASVESPQLAAAVRRQGYAPALVVDAHKSAKAYVAHGVRWIPCPQQTRGIGCTDCGLCLDADALFARHAGIAFEAHGEKKNAVKRRLTVIK